MHEPLKENHRAEYGWYDPLRRTTVPNDQVGHGTHTMGTLAGRAKIIGVAPESNWIACKGCVEEGCSRFALLQCGEWTVCPSDPQGNNRNCSMAPLVSSNSWGASFPNNYYDDILSAYETVGIHAVFSIGNRGPECQTTRYPGTQ